ncbi:MAG: N-acetyltransferase [Clostridia bacterium]|nr:N-acetyltransferase [Clostridia bacterium]
MEVTLRNITPEDAPMVAQIYAHYIRHTVATFHETPKSVDGYLQQIKELSAVYPFLVAEADGRFLGFANAEPFRPQSGYRYTAELTIYLHPDAPKHSGIGRKLYSALLTQLKELHYVNVLACISGENESSIAFHRSFGFEEMAVFPKVAYKHDRWLDAVWMRKTLLSTEHSPEEPMRVNI